MPPIAKCGWSRRAAGYEVRSVRGVPWSVRCGYLRSFDFGSYYQSTPRAAAVRVQLVQGSSGTCLRCTPRLWRVGETGIAHFSPVPKRPSLGAEASHAPRAGPTHDPERPLAGSRTNPAPSHRTHCAQASGRAVPFGRSAVAYEATSLAPPVRSTAASAVLAQHGSSRLLPDQP